MGSDFSTQHYGIVPTALSWLFRALSADKVKFSIRVSALAVMEDSTVRDILKETFDAGDERKNDVEQNLHLYNDPNFSSPLRNPMEMKATNIERAGFILDGVQNWKKEIAAPFNLFFTITLYQVVQDRSLRRERKYQIYNYFSLRFLEVMREEYPETKRTNFRYKHRNAEVLNLKNDRNYYKLRKSEINGFVRVKVRSSEFF